MALAFLGLGHMGSILAGHLVADGEAVIVWNRSPERADDLAAQGASVAATAAEAVANADVVISALFGPDAVRDVVLRGALPFEPHALWIDITTVAPHDTEEFAEWARDNDVRYVAAPVIGSLVPAANRALGTALGGPPDALAEAEPIVGRWTATGRLATYDSPAKAALAKLIANLGIAVASQGIVEALRLGHGGGMTTQETLGALAGTALEKQASLKADLLSSQDFSATQFSTDLLAKDIRLMIATAAKALPAATIMLDALENAQARGRGGDDFGVIFEPDL